MFGIRLDGKFLHFYNVNHPDIKIDKDEKKFQNFLHSEQNPEIRF